MNSISVDALCLSPLPSSAAAKSDHWRQDCRAFVRVSFLAFIGGAPIPSPMFIWMRSESGGGNKHDPYHNILHQHQVSVYETHPYLNKTSN